MPIYKIQATINAVSGETADAVVNNWHCSSNNDISSADWTAIVAAFNTFYSGSSFGFSPAMNNAGHSLKIFNYADPHRRVPRYTGTFSLSIGGGLGAPAEVAICLSGRKNPVSGGNVRKERGRVYLGPWSAATVNTPRVANSLCTQITTAATALFHSLQAITGNIITLGVTSEPGNTLYQYQTFFVDNAWDIQRRRGVKADFRSTVAVP